MSFPYTVNLDYGSEKITGTAKKYSLGTRGTTPDGRVYYYALNGGTAIETGRLVQAPVMEGSTGGALQGGTTVFVTAGSSKTTGATTVAFLPTTGLGASQLVDGWLIAMTTPSRAMYKIKTQPTSGSSLNAVEITLYEQDKLIHPLTTAHRLAVIANPYSSTIVMPATATGAVMGATCSNVAANAFYWLQTFGPSMVEYNAGQQSVGTGDAIRADTSVAGAFMGAVAFSVVGAGLTTGAGGEVANLQFPTIGWIHTLGAVDAIAGFVFLTIRA
jgi:hypothetical protein